MDTLLRRTLDEWAPHFTALFAVAAWAPTTVELRSHLLTRAALGTRVANELSTAGLIVTGAGDRWVINHEHPLYAAVCDQWINRRQAVDSAALLDDRVAVPAGDVLELTAGSEDSDGVSAAEAVLVATWADAVADQLPALPATGDEHREVPAGEREARVRGEGVAAGARYAAALLRSAARRATREPRPEHGVVRISRAAWEAAQAALRGRRDLSGDELVSLLETALASDEESPAALDLYGDLSKQADDLAARMAGWVVVLDPGPNPGPDTEFENLRGPLLW